MDISKLSNGAKLVLGGSALMLIASFFNWNEVEFSDVLSAGVSMWHGWGSLAGILLLVLIAWEILQLMGVKIALPISRGMITALVAGLLLLSTILKVLVDNEFRTFWAWIGLILAVVIAFGAVTTLKEGGESLADMKGTIAAGAAAAAAAAKSASENVTSSSPEPPTATTATPVEPAVAEQAEESDKT